MTTTDRWILRNVARRPVEVHQASGSVVIIPAFGMIEVEALEPEHHALAKSGALTCHATPKATAEAAPQERGAKGKRALTKKIGAKRRPARKDGRKVIGKRAARVADDPTGADQ